LSPLFIPTELSITIWALGIFIFYSEVRTLSEDEVESCLLRSLRVVADFVAAFRPDFVRFSQGFLMASSEVVGGGGR
jgi:hypothetical protein